MMGTQLVPVDEYPRDYYTTDDWTDRSIQYLKELRASSPTKPFLLYLAHNAVHAPLQAKPRTSPGTGAATTRAGPRYARHGCGSRSSSAWCRRTRGSRPPIRACRPWDVTDPADRPLLARHMEVYAAMLDSVDQNLGRLVAFLGEIGELDNTILVFASDNGGTDAGGPTGMFNNNRRYMGLAAPPIEEERALAPDLGSPRGASLYPTGWGEVSNTPFPSFKTYTGAGGRRVSLIVSWPGRLREVGAIRRQFVHVIDVMPTAARPRRCPATAGGQRPSGPRPWTAPASRGCCSTGRRPGRAPSSTTSAGRTARTTGTAGSPARSRSAASRSTSTTGRCITWRATSPRAST